MFTMIKVYIARALKIFKGLRQNRKATKAKLLNYRNSVNSNKIEAGARASAKHIGLPIAYIDIRTRLELSEKEIKGYQWNWVKWLVSFDHQKRSCVLIEGYRGRKL